MEFKQLLVSASGHLKLSLERREMLLRHLRLFEGLREKEMQC